MTGFESESVDTAEVFDSFCTLTSIAPEPGGLLVFYGELDTHGMAIAAASNIAGSASLGVDMQAERVKLALRNGICDFMVNSLDEALRILKNEIRKKQPVAVGLVGDPDRVVAEMIERGVQPDLVVPGGLGSHEFAKGGAKFLTDTMLAADSIAVRWSVAQEPAEWLPRVDAAVIEALGDSSGPRTKWLRAAPRYLQKNLSRERFVRMSGAELARFTALLREHLRSGDITVPVTVLSNGTAISI
ncbi:MAG TPA: hypothetical protein VHT24_04925 [Pseudacidobacterium sp.]|jgi:urocanate hydratase|nr:hypothetical protein [Pseudacidobacterium sp.]